MEEVNIHLIDFIKWSFEKDMISSAIVKGVRGKYGLDTLIKDSSEKLPILERYCSRYNIEVKETNPSKVLDEYLDILLYLRNNKDKRNLFYIPSMEHLEKIVNLFKEDGRFKIHKYIPEVI